MMLPRATFYQPGFYPEIKDIVQVNVRQEWRNHGTLRRSHLRLGPLAVFRHSGLQPFLDQAKHTAIGLWSRILLSKAPHRGGGLIFVLLRMFS